MTYEAIRAAVPWYIAGLVGVGIVLVLAWLAERRQS